MRCLRSCHPADLGYHLGLWRRSYGQIRSCDYYRCVQWRFVARDTRGIRRRSVAAQGVQLVKISQPCPSRLVSRVVRPRCRRLIEPLFSRPWPRWTAGRHYSRMARYHLGYAGPDAAPDQRAADRGKRMRPAVALLAAGAAGGEPRAAAPVAAAIELLHNFTLIHDDIQDESPTRRHRPTVWTLWGIGQAINAGDALFAAAHLPLYRLARPAFRRSHAASPRAFDRMTIAIVEGQTLDLAFEARPDVHRASIWR